MRLAFVVQRYGSDIVGGAESHARQIAERLAASNKDDTIDVFTTCARSYETWSNEYAPGIETIAGVNVHRFPTLFPRFTWLFNLFSRLVTPLLARHRQLPAFLKPLLLWLERLWYVLQGPWVPNLIKAINAQHENYDHIFFFTYLYYPTVLGMPALAEKATLVPTAHAEPPLKFAHSKQLFQTARRVFVNTIPEKQLIEEATGITGDKYTRVGIGVDTLVQTNGEDQKRQTPSPYLLYLGRLSNGKQTHRLTKDFAQLCADHPGEDFQLVLAGLCDKNFHLTPHPQIEYRGYVSDAERLTLIKNAAAVVNPSEHESLSLIVVEALALGTPALVSGKSPVLAWYSREVPSVFAFDDYNQFAKKALSLLRGESRPEDLSLAQNWVAEHFSWTNVLESYRKVVGNI